jgi:LysR family glycine cleavage system transcriptional activator
VQASLLSPLVSETMIVFSCLCKSDLLNIGIEKLSLKDMPVAPPRPKGPPLNALRAFEAAARLGGFTQAADELCVTPGAISQHVKFLEEWLGAPLFERRSQGVKLTILGANVVEQFSAAFDTMSDAVRAMRMGASQPTINIAALPSVAQLWLSPRLPAIRAALSNHKISVTALEVIPNLSRELFDISVFIDTPSYDHSERIIEPDIIFPVCSPEVASRIHTPSDLLNEVWLYDTVWADDWSLWAKHALTSPKTIQDGPRFSLYSIALEEAKNSAGVLMGHEALVSSQLEDGNLVIPFDLKISTGKALLLKTAGHTEKHSAVGQLIEMLGH